MALTVEQQLKKAFKVSASMLPILMYGGEVQINRLYCEEIGETERESNYAMQLGSLVEPFMLDYLEKTTGHPITRRGEVVDHPTIKDFCCTLDGYRAFDDAVIENKFLRPGQNRDEFGMYYFPQVLAQARCTGAKRMILHVGVGTSEPIEYDLTPKPSDAEALAAYETAMWARVEEFRNCLLTFTPPFPMPKIVPPEIWRTVDLRKHPAPNWGYLMQPWLEIYEGTRAAAKEHEEAGKEARALVPDDVSVVLTGEHKLSRDKRGVIRITRDVE
jgi:hypothetical protein